jgi:hypothetical protein
MITNVADYRRRVSLLGLMASDYAQQHSAVSRINPDSPHGKVKRPPAKDLSGLHSADSVFMNQLGEAFCKEVYRGHFLAIWYHHFTPAMLRDLQHGVFDHRFPRFDIQIGLVLPDAPMCQGRVYTISHADGWTLHTGWSEELELTANQDLFLGWRAIHQLLRVTGCDFGCGTLFFACSGVLRKTSK